MPEIFYEKKLAESQRLNLLELKMRKPVEPWLDHRKRIEYDKKENKIKKDYTRISKELLENNQKIKPISQVDKELEDAVKEINKLGTDKPKEISHLASCIDSIHSIIQMEAGRKKYEALLEATDQEEIQQNGIKALKNLKEHGLMEKLEEHTDLEQEKKTIDDLIKEGKEGDFYKNQLAQHLKKESKHFMEIRKDLDRYAREHGYSLRDRERLIEMHTYKHAAVKELIKATKKLSEKENKEAIKNFLKKTELEHEGKKLYSLINKN